MAAPSIDDPIPADSISLVEAFRQLYRSVTPNWEFLDNQLADEALTIIQDSPFRHCELPASQTTLEFDVAQQRANEILRIALIDGALTAYVRDPENGERLRLTADAWAETVVVPSGVTSNFVSPDDASNPGPYTSVRGARRPVFLIKAEFERWRARISTAAEPPKYRTGAPGKPSGMKLVELEFERRRENNELENKLEGEAEALLQWYNKEHPTLPRLTEKTIKNNLRTAYRKTRGKGPIL